ncbi:hypothetical protein PPE03_12550 [Pseudoalteromonas peptidolytica]|nr:hypothetical protein PPE03_12550 [Pseudoalteromonas peptidolytica]
MKVRKPSSCLMGIKPTLALTYPDNTIKIRGNKISKGDMRKPNIIKLGAILSMNA